MPSFVLCNMASKRNCHSMKCYPLKLSTRPASASIVGSMFYMPIDVPPLLLRPAIPYPSAEASWLHVRNVIDFLPTQRLEPNDGGHHHFAPVQALSQVMCHSMRSGGLVTITTHDPYNEWAWPTRHHCWCCSVLVLGIC